jgi:CBS domain-containing protein
MFHLFTLQGKRIDAQLEQLPKNLRVHHAKSNNRVRKFDEGGSNSSDAGKGIGSYGAGIYKEASKIEYEKSPVFHASDIMSSPVFTISEDIYVNDAWIKFTEKKVHHMPVLSGDGKLIGIVSDRDLLKKLIISDGRIETAGDALVRDIMSTDVIATTPLTDIRRIAKAMLDHHIGAMPIVNAEGTIVGIISRSDILYAIIHNPELNLWA